MAMLRKWTPTRAFLLAMLVGMSPVLANAWWSWHQSRPSIEFKELTRSVWVTSQVSLEDIDAIGGFVLAMGLGLIEFVC